MNYPSKRNLVYGSQGMVATGNALAAQAGLEILKKGGNAIDAALATSLCLTVTECRSNGLGGDLFALVYYKGHYYGLNSHGPAPALLSPEALKERGLDTIPTSGPEPITVPGLVAGISALQERFSQLTWEELIGPARDYARDGFALQPTHTIQLNRERLRYENELGKIPSLQTWFDTYLQGRKEFKEGEILKLPNQALALEELARTKGRSFYKGRIAKDLDRYMKEVGGFLRKEDLEAFSPQWVEPLKTDYKNHIIYELPPSGQGISVLMALEVLKKTGYSHHLAVEAMKLSLYHLKLHMADEGHMKHSIEEFLEDFPNKAQDIINDKASLPEDFDLMGSNTVYLCTADREGNMISLIQSNYMGFGSGLVLPSWGIALHNRACNFSLDPLSPNCLAPGKRPYHTIIPGFIEKPGHFRGPFGIMGAFMQPQGQLQILMNMIEEGLDPQAALDKPRWQWIGGARLHLEKGYSKDLIEDLKNRGHQVEIIEDPIPFGRGEIILRYEDGRLVGACEPRTDAQVAAW